MSRRSFSRGLVPLMALITLMNVFFAPPARAEDTITTQPYADPLDLGVLKELDISGKGITIVLISGPVSTSASELQGADITIVTPYPYTPTPGPISHGTAIVSLPVLPDYGITPGAIIINHVTPPRGEDLTQEDRRYATGFTRIITLVLNDGVDIISYSVSGSSGGAMAPTLTKVDLDRAIVIAAMGDNNQKDYVESYTSSNLIVGVTATDIHGNRANYFNYGKGTTAAFYGGPVSTCDYPSGRIYHEAKGTSIITALTSGCLALATGKWSEVTNRQILQSLVHTAVRGDGVERGPGYGYGPANLRDLLTEDPISLPDENPLPHKNDKRVPNEEYYNGYIDSLLDPVDHWIQGPNYAYRGSDPGVVRTTSHKTACGAPSRYRRDLHIPPAPPTPPPNGHHHTSQKQTYDTSTNIPS